MTQIAPATFTKLVEAAAALPADEQTAALLSAVTYLGEDAAAKVVLSLQATAAVKVAL